MEVNTQVIRYLKRSARATVIVTGNPVRTPRLYKAGATFVIVQASWEASCCRVAQEKDHQASWRRVKG